MKHFIAAPFAASALLLGALGVVHGLATDRWGPSGQLEAALTKLNQVPASFGDWASTESEMDAEMMARGGIKGWVSRRYQNSRTREAVTLLLVCGRGGPISVHTPDVCYTGAGYRQIGESPEKELDLGADGRQLFRVYRYALPGGVSQTQLEIFLAWSRDGRVWDAPQNPRFSLARSPALYKLYVVREFVPGTRSESVDSCETFLRRALPDIARTLTPDS